MKKIDLLNFFDIINYDWKKDEEKIKNICFYTKSRVDPNGEKFSLGYGMEQPFLVKAVAEWKSSKSFFEIGTGRGTACYSLSLLDDVENISTIDIIPFEHKRNEAIGYAPAHVSNFDLYNMIPYNQKEKINFFHRKDIPQILETKGGESVDLFFIDGNHSNPAIIMEDYILCKKMMNEGSIIIWDDYDIQKFVVKDVLEHIQKSDKSLDTLLVEFRGHLFGNKKPEKNAGMVLMKRGKFDESFSS